MDSSSLDIRKGINYDYILASDYMDGVVRTVKIPIKRHLKTLESLIHMVYDDEYTVKDMQDLFERDIPDKGPFQYCLKHKYSDSYIGDIVFPNESFVKYRGIINLKKKKDFIRKYLPYIYAIDYSRALESNSVKGKFSMFSNEEHGRFAYSHKVTDDIIIKTSTNFCYGSSSFFHLTVSYKGIKLLPYSVWVKYYYAGYSELMSCTRSFYVDRTSWDYCLSFIEKFTNKAIQDPEQFIREDVMYEVNGLLEGLEYVFAMSEDDYKARLDVEHTSGEDRYIGIRMVRQANKADRYRYHIRPAECALVYKMGKICDALYFLRTLEQLREIYDEVSRVIKRIKEMNIALLPDVMMVLNNVKSEVDSIKAEYDQLDKKLTKKENRLSWMNNKLNTQLSRNPKMKDEVRRKIIEFFIRDYPDYDDLKKEVNVLTGQKNLISKNLSDRQRLLTQLQQWENMIKRYAKA